MEDSYSVIFISEEQGSASVGSSKGFTVDLTSDDGGNMTHISKTELSDGSATSGKCAIIKLKQILIILLFIGVQ